MTSRALDTLPAAKKITVSHTAADTHFKKLKQQVYENIQ
jgi:hypothetical protein